MYSLLKYALGPELYWILLTLTMKLLGMRNVPATEAGSRALEPFLWYLAFIGVPLTFAALFYPFPSRGWMFGRVAVSAFIGIIFAAYAVTGYIDYRDSRNSGVPMGWVMSIAFGWFMLAVSSIVAGIILWWRARHHP